MLQNCRLLMTVIGATAAGPIPEVAQDIHPQRFVFRPWLRGARTRHPFSIEAGCPVAERYPEMVVSLLPKRLNVETPAGSPRMQLSLCRITRAASLTPSLLL